MPDNAQEIVYCSRCGCCTERSDGSCVGDCYVAHGTEADARRDLDEERTLFVRKREALGEMADGFARSLDDFRGTL